MCLSHIMTTGFTEYQILTVSGTLQQDSNMKQLIVNYYLKVRV